MNDSVEELQKPLNPADEYNSKSQNPDKSYHWFLEIDTNTLLRRLRFINVILSLFQGIAGFMGLLDLMMLSITRFLIALYSILFSIMLLCFECRFSSMEAVLRRNFGFMFTYLGRALFICFMAFVDFGMKDTIAWFAGFFMCINGLLNISIMLWHPAFRQGSLKTSMDPTKAYATTGEEEARNWLSKHPEAAVEAFSLGKSRNPS